MNRVLLTFFTSFCLLSAVFLIGLSFNVQLVKASETIYIRADGSIDPPTAPIESVDNVTYTFTDNIYDEIVIERNNIIVDGNGFALQGAGAGVGFTLNGNNVTIRNTVITGFDIVGSEFAAAIYSLNTLNNVITNNTITGNKWGIDLEWVTDCVISGNEIGSQSQSGIYMRESRNNIISNNNISSNKNGITLVSYSNYNKIYHNNFINNTNQAYPYDSTNVWDDGYPSGGNYWSDYNGTDIYSGPNQDQFGSDGIGDKPYDIAYMQHVDRYPLMNPCGPDFTPPATLHDYDGLWYTSDFTITLSATDDLSGVAETYYIINNGSTQNVTAYGQPLIITESANNTLEYWSIDNNGNEELPHKILTGIKLDKTYPTIETPSRTPDGDVLPDESVKVSVNVTDATSQVKNVTLYYTTDNGNTWTDLPLNNTASNLYEASIPPQQANTTVRFRIVAYDNAGNNATLDGTEPYTVYQVIPEFPSFLILPLFMIAMLLAVIVYRRKHPQNE